MNNLYVLMQIYPIGSQSIIATLRSTLFTLTLLFGTVDYTFSQQVINVDITQLVYKACQDQFYEFDVNLLHNGSSAIPRDSYFRSIGPTNSCMFELQREVENNSLKIEGPGIGEYTTGKRSNGRYFIKVKFTSTAPYTISWRTGQYFPTNNCGVATTSEYIFRGSSQKVYYIPTPPKPTLIAQKAVIKYPESTTVSCHCPHSLKDEPDANSYGWTNWSNSCNPDGTPYFRENWGIPDGEGGNYIPIAPHVATVYRVQCNDNGCYSEVSDPVAVGSQSTPPNCGDPKMEEIDRYSRDGRLDYHHFTVETVVCNKADGNPNCSVQKVFELLKSRKDHNVFIASEFPDVLPVGGAYVKAGLQLIGSDLVFHIDQTPVSNCELFNLAGPLSMAMNLTTLATFVSYVGIPTGRKLHSFLQPHLPAQSTLLPVANPIAQYIDESSYTVTNYTKRGHVFYPGKVVRSVVEDCNRVKIITIGVGRHYLTDIGYAMRPLLLPVYGALAGYIAEVMGQKMGEINTSSGPVLFNDVDQRLIGGFNKLPK